MIDLAHFLMAVLMPAFGFLCALCYSYSPFASTKANWRAATIIGGAGTVLWCLMGTLALSLIHQLAFLPVLIWWAGGTAAVAVIARRMFGVRYTKVRKALVHKLTSRLSDANLIKEILACYIVTGLVICLQIIIVRFIFRGPSDLRPEPLLTWWGISAIPLIIFYKSISKTAGPCFERWREKYVSRVDVWIAAVGICCVVGGAMVSAIFSPPNNWDVMSYHLPRQIIWMSDRSALLFSDPKLYFAITKMPPLSEYLGVNLYLLSGSDRWHNLIQWTALILSLNLISLIIENLGFSKKAQIFAGLVFCTVPLVYFQASDSKNDLLMTVFILAVAWSVTRQSSNSVFSKKSAVLCGLNAGFALLTKATAIAFLPIIGLFSLIYLWSRGVKNGFMALVTIIGICLLISGYHYLATAGRNLKTETGDNAEHLNADFSLTSMLSVLTRNYLLQLATPSENLNAFLYSLNRNIHTALNKDINDPKTTFGGKYFEVQYVPTFEGCATSLPLFLTILFLPFLALCHKSWKTTAELLCMTALAYCLLIAFSWVFRWQPFHSRLLVPVYAFAALPAGVAISCLKSRILSGTICFAYILWLFPSLYFWDRPLLGNRSVILTGEEEKRCLVQGSGEINLGMRRLIKNAKPKSLFIDLGDKVYYPIYPIIQALGLPDGTWPKIVREYDRSSIYEAVILGAGCELNPSGLLVNMEKVFDQDGWQLWFSKDAAERAFIGEFGPFFGYSKFSSPVGDYQGPYESLPAFRHFFYPETCMNVSGSTVKRNLQLLMMQYPGGGWTTCSIYADTDLLGEIQLGVEIPKKPLIIPLGLRTNDFCLKFVFSSGTKTPYERQPVAARVFLLQITH